MKIEIGLCTFPAARALVLKRFQSSRILKGFGLDRWGVGTHDRARRPTTTLVSLARHARMCGSNFAAQTALIRCFEPDRPKRLSVEEQQAVDPRDSQVFQSWLCLAV